jgi:chitinase domain-containing protein 1
VKKKSSNVKIVPRVIFDHWGSKHFLEIFDDQNLADKLGYLISKTIADYKFDGIVLELWSQLGGQAKLQTTQLVSKTDKPIKNDYMTKT